MLRLELDAAIRDYLNRPKLSTATIGIWVSSVEGELNTLLNAHPRSLKRAQYIQVADNPLVPLPVDFLAIKTLMTGDDLYDQLAPDKRLTAQNEALNGGFKFILRGDCAEVFPSPVINTTFYLDYYAALTPLNVDNAENWVSKFFPDIYIYGLLKEAALYLKDRDNFSLWQQEWGNRVKVLRLQGWDQGASSGLRAWR